MIIKERRTKYGDQKRYFLLLESPQHTQCKCSTCTELQCTVHGPHLHCKCGELTCTLLHLHLKYTGNSYTGTESKGRWPALSTGLKPHVHWKCAGVRAKLGAFRRSVRAISEISALPAARAAPATPPHASPPARRSEPCHPLPTLQRPTDLRCLSPQVSLVVRSYRGRDVPARET